MNDRFDDLLDRVRDMALPAADYVIFGSAPLRVRGIIPSCNDLDILCRGSVWDYARSQGELVYLDEYDVTVATFCDRRITFGTEWAIGDVDVDELITSAELIDGLCFAPLEAVVRYKTIRNSVKDREHIESLMQSSFLSRTGVSIPD